MRSTLHPSPPTHSPPIDRGPRDVFSRQSSRPTVRTCHNVLDRFCSLLRRGLRETSPRSIRAAIESNSSANAFIFSARARRSAATSPSFRERGRRRPVAHWRSASAFQVGLSRRARYKGDEIACFARMNKLATGSPPSDSFPCPSPFIFSSTSRVSVAPNACHTHQQHKSDSYPVSLLIRGMRRQNEQTGELSMLLTDQVCFRQATSKVDGPQGRRDASSRGGCGNTGLSRRFATTSRTAGQSESARSPA